MTGICCTMTREEALVHAPTVAGPENCGTSVCNRSVPVCELTRVLVVTDDDAGPPALIELSIVTTPDAIMLFLSS